MGKAAWELRKHRSFWLDWFGSKGRKIGCSKSWYTDNPNVFLNTVEHSISNRYHCFISVQPYRSAGVVFGMEKVFFDFNSKTNNPNLKETFKEIRCFTKRLKERLDVEPLLLRTLRGFHVYVFLQKTVEFGFGHHNPWELTYRLLQNEMLDGVPHSTLNEKCLGNLKNLARVPYSVHEAGIKCLPVDFHGRPIHVEDLDGHREGGIDQNLLRQLVGEGAEKAINIQNPADINGKHPTVFGSSALCPETPFPFL